MRSSTNLSTTILAATLSVLALFASGVGCALETAGTGGTGGRRGPPVSDGGPSSGGGGAGGAGGMAGNNGGAAGGSTAGDASRGGAGGSSGAGGSADSGGISPYANFAAIREIVLFKCGGSGCHSGETEPRLVDEPKLYSTLTTYVAKKCGNRVLVKAGSPQESAFFLAQHAMCGSTLPQMPLGCVDSCTPSDYLEGVRQWIANGAREH